MNYSYITNTKPIGGRIKQISEDFIVEEIGNDYETKLTYLPDKKVEMDWDEVFSKKGDNEYLLVDLEKFNLSTTTAISQMTRYLRCSKNRVSYAGLKDKRAITVQRVSIFDPNFEQISKFYYKNIKIYNPVWSNQKIDIGDLKQNRFTITIRKIINFEIEDLKKQVLEFIGVINSQGIINYFGEQRFGGVRQITHKVGKYLLQKKYKEAIMLYLTESFDLENEDLKLARKQLKEDCNFRKHAANFPTRTGYEKTILNYLANNNDDYLGALRQLPKSIQFLFIHAYQSYLFNELINLRFEKGFGLEKIDGDKIIDDNICLQLFGFESRFSSGKLGELERELFKKEEITFDDFYNKDYSVLSSKGDYRALKSKVYDLKLIDISEDELNQEDLPNSKKVTVSFTLDKGNYATNVMRELIKPEIIGWF